MILTTISQIRRRIYGKEKREKKIKILSYKERHKKAKYKTRNYQIIKKIGKCHTFYSFIHKSVFCFCLSSLVCLLLLYHRCTLDEMYRNYDMRLFSETLSEGSVETPYY